MKSAGYPRYVSFCACAALISLAGCTKANTPPPDHPRLTSRVVMRDIVFRSVALNRDMPYRVILPATIPAGQRLPVIYLLHGGGGGFRDWTNYSDVARFVEEGMILVMPEGSSSYYVNSTGRPQDHFEDYIVADLIADVEAKFPVAVGRSSRAIVGISMGGFGAINLSLKHPQLFAFAGALSPAIDVPSRPFSIKRVGQWREHSAIFGVWGSRTRHDNDPYVLARSVDPKQMPYLFLSCGEQEGLLPANRRFAAELAQRHFRYEFYTGPGSHDWNQWNGRLPTVFGRLSEYVR